MSAIYYTDTFKGVLYNLTIKEWSLLTGIPRDTIYGRHNKWTRGLFPKKDILFVGILDSNKRARRPLKPKKDMSWLYRPANWNIEKLKYLYLDIELSPYMGGKRG